MGFFYFCAVKEEKNKLALITGASAGIGKACARKFAAEGWSLLLTGRREHLLYSLQKELKDIYNAAVDVCIFDMRDDAAMEKALFKYPEKMEAIDLLVNNAGLALGKDHLDDADIGDLYEMIDTNVKALMHITKLVLPGMKKRRAGQIINLSSVAGREVYEGGTGYCASKHAVDAITRALRIELLPYHIRVGSISPGMVETEFSLVRFKGDIEKAARVYAGIKPLTAEDIAACIAWMASLPDHISINDIVLTPNGQADANHIFRT